MFNQADFKLVLASWDTDFYRSLPRATHKQYLLDQAFIKLQTLPHAIFIPFKSSKAIIEYFSSPGTLFTGKIQGLTQKVLVLVIKQHTIW